MLGGCASQLKLACTIHPRLNTEYQSSVGQTFMKKGVCASREEWRGLAGGGMVKVAECFSAELLYLGKSGDTIRVGYREYAKDMARPAYSMEATYPAMAGKITFRNTVIEITEIGTDYTKYKLIDTPIDARCTSVEFQ